MKQAIARLLAAALLYILPEMLRNFDVSKYRMLIYAIILILVMLATNNPTIRGFFLRLRQQTRERKGGQVQ